MSAARDVLFREWVRDVEANGLADLTLLRLPHDHFGNFGTALGTPSLQIADNDYAIGQGSRVHQPLGPLARYGDLHA